MGNNLSREAEMSREIGASEEGVIINNISIFCFHVIGRKVERDEALNVKGKQSLRSTHNQARRQSSVTGGT